MKDVYFSEASLEPIEGYWCDNTTEGTNDYSSSQALKELEYYKAENGSLKWENESNCSILSNELPQLIRLPTYEPPSISKKEESIAKELHTIDESESTEGSEEMVRTVVIEHLLGGGEISVTRK